MIRLFLLFALVLQAGCGSNTKGSSSPSDLTDICEQYGGDAADDPQGALTQAQGDVNRASASLAAAVGSAGQRAERQAGEATSHADKARVALAPIVCNADDAEPRPLARARLLGVQADIIRWHASNLAERDGLAHAAVVEWLTRHRDEAARVAERLRPTESWDNRQLHAIDLQLLNAALYFQLDNETLIDDVYQAARQRLESDMPPDGDERLVAQQLLALLDAQVGGIIALVVKGTPDTETSARVPDWQRALAGCVALTNISQWRESLVARAAQAVRTCDAWFKASGERIPEPWSAAVARSGFARQSLSGAPPVQTAPKPPVKEQGLSESLPTSILFDYDKCHIKRQSFTALRRVARLLKQHPEWGTTRIEAHASAEKRALQGRNGTHRQYNVRLSRCRAERVVKFLVHNGVSRSRLAAVGFGHDCPLVPHTNEQNRKINRRVAFVINAESNAPTCKVPRQLEPLRQHASEPYLYKEPTYTTPIPPAP